MKKLVIIVLSIFIFLASLVVPVAAEVDDITSPPVSFTTTRKDTGALEVSLNWESQAMSAFDYAVVYDETKVKVQSVRFKGTFLSKYTGDTNGYGGMAVANDNGGYVVLGGIFEVQEGYTAPVYTGVIATITFIPKEDDSKEASDKEISATEENGSEQIIPDFDAGSLTLVEGASNYTDKEEVLHAASTTPMVYFQVNDAVDSMSEDSEIAVAKTEGSYLVSESQTENSEENVAIENIIPGLEESVSVISDDSENSIISSGAATSAFATKEAVLSTAGKLNKNNDMKQKENNALLVWVPVLLIGVLLAGAAYVVIRAKNAQK